MPSPGSFAMFAVVNAIVWPGFALAYWYRYQREEERLMNAVTQQSGEQGDSTGRQQEPSGTGGDS